MSRFATFTASFFTAAAILTTGAAALVAKPSEAMACRDCPFPMKIGDSRWLMPNRQVTIEIDETELPSQMVELSVSLLDSRNCELLAVGYVRIRKNWKAVTLHLVDTEGNDVRGYIRWADNDREVLQAKFTCDGDCSIEHMLD